jgi:hypothetical protein
VDGMGIIRRRRAKVGMTSISHRFAGKACSPLDGFSPVRGLEARCRRGAIGIIGQSDGACLVYCLTNQDGGTTHVDELVPFAYTPARFGGRRQWLTCLQCRRRCRRIFGGRYFDAGNATASCTPPHVRRHTSEPSIVPSASESGRAVSAAHSTMNPSRRSRSGCDGGPIGASRSNTRNCNGDGRRT